MFSITRLGPTAGVAQELAEGLGHPAPGTALARHSHTRTALARLVWVAKRSEFRSGLVGCQPGTALDFRSSPRTGVSDVRVSRWMRLLGQSSE